MKGRTIFLMVAALTLAGCGWSFYRAVQPYNRAMYSWLGAPVNEVRKSWGQPDSIVPQAGGRIFYIWTRTGQVPDPEMRGLPTVQLTCRTVLVADNDGRIANFDPDGVARSCAKLPPPPSRPGS